MTGHDESVPEVHDDVTTIRITRPGSGVVLIGLFAVLAALVLLDAASRVAGGGLIARFSLGGQSTVANWWASVQLLALFALLWIVAAREKKSGYRWTSWTLRIGAGVALILSLEETARLQQSIPIGLVRSDLVASIDAAQDLVRLIVLATGLILLVLAVPGILDLLKRHRVNTAIFLFGGVLLFGGGAALDAADLIDPAHVKAVVEDVFQFVGIALMLWATYRVVGSDELQIVRR